jgi:hypothetical protein
VLRCSAVVVREVLLRLLPRHRFALSFYLAISSLKVRWTSEVLSSDG